jgi:hypothetical protein
MAATGRKPLAFAAILCIALVARADEVADALATVNHVADALSAGNAAEAMAQFSKSYPQYDKLKNDFSGLTDAYSLTSEATIADERALQDAVDLRLDWTLTLVQPNTTFSTQRQAEIRVHVARIRGKWKITEFSPIDIFNPGL